LELRLAAPAKAVVAGEAVRQTGDRVLLPLGSVRRVQIEGVSAEAAQAAFAQARLHLGKQVWLQAAKFAKIASQMGLASQHHVEDKEAFGDFVVTLQPSPIPDREPWFVQYEVALPHAGDWYLWARVWYKDANLNSYSLALGDGPNTGEPFGNDAGYGVWHWDGGAKLAAKTTKLRFRLYEREAGPPADGPRLDVLCLSDDPAYKPSDEDFRVSASVP
jgi:hypothetical protein